MANWFAYMGGNIFLPGSYQRIPDVNPAPICIGGCNICAIYLDDYSVGIPASINAIMDYLVNAHVSRATQPPLPAKPFILMRSCP